MELHTATEMEGLTFTPGQFTFLHIRVEHEFLEYISS